jgi:tetratricopeptide (TPR) repeat protein
MGTALRSMAAEEDLRTGEESPYWVDSLDAYEKSLLITTKLKSFRDIGNTYNNLAIVYKSRKHADSSLALTFAQKAKENLSRVNAPVDLLDNLRITGAIYAQAAQYNLALSELEQSLSLANKIAAKDKIGLAYMEIGTVHHKIGDMNSASYYYKEALKVFIDVGAPKRVRYIQNLLDLTLHNLEAPVSNPE